MPNKMIGEVVATPGERFPYKVVISYEGQFNETPVLSVADGERLIIAILQGVKDLAKREGL